MVILSLILMVMLTLILMVMLSLILMVILNLILMVIFSLILMVILSRILMVILSRILMVTVFAAPPKINVPPRFREVCTFEKGENVVLKIPFTGNPKPTVKWIRDGEELRGTRYHQEVTERHAILTIKVRTVVKVTVLGNWWVVVF